MTIIRLVSPNRLQRQSPVLPLAVLVILIFSASSVRADTIYTNFGPGDTYAVGAGVLVTNDELAQSSVAIAFTPAEDYYLTSIEFVVSDLISDDSGNLTVGIFADNAGQPDSTPLESFTTSPAGQFGSTVPVMTVTSILNPLLQANTQYWIGINAAPGDLIVWNQNLVGALGFSETDGSGNWSMSDPLQGQGTLEVDGIQVPANQLPVPSQSSEGVSFAPEPGAWWLMGGGLAALIFFARRLRATPQG